MYFEGQEATTDCRVVRRVVHRSSQLHREPGIGARVDRLEAAHVRLHSKRNDVSTVEVGLERIAELADIVDVPQADERAVVDVQVGHLRFCSVIFAGVAPVETGDVHEGSATLLALYVLPVVKVAYVS